MIRTLMLAGALAVALSAGCKDEAGAPATGGGAAAEPAAGSEAAAPKVPRVADMPMHDLEGLREKIRDSGARYTLVAVWATWCSPCIEEMPTLGRFYQEHRDDGLNVIGLSIDDRGEMGPKIQKIMDEVKAPFEMVFLKTGTEESFFEGLGIDWDGTLPGTVVFDAKAGKTLFLKAALTEATLREKVLPLLRDPKG